MKNHDISKNAPNWYPSKDDYVLVFMLVNGLWKEVSHNLPEYSDTLLCDYLLEYNLHIPDYTQFMRIHHPDYTLEYRSYGGRVRFDYKKRGLE